MSNKGFLFGGVGLTADARAVAAVVEVDDFAVAHDDEAGLGLAGEEDGVATCAACGGEDAEHVGIFGEF